MNLAAAVAWIAQSPLGEAYRANTFVLIFIQSLHFLGACLLFGPLAILALRIFGVGRTVSLAAAAAFLPLALGGLILDIGTGIMMLNVGQETNLALQLKLVLIVAGTLTTIRVAGGVRRASLDPAGVPPAGGSLSWGAAVSLALLVGVIVLSRLIPIFDGI